MEEDFDDTICASQVHCYRNPKNNPAVRRREGNFQI